MATLKTLVLGGYGNFGARICRALAGDAATRHHIALLVAGRDASRAQALANTLGHGAQGVVLDHQAPGLAASLREWGVDLVIHTAGPFQAQGYSVAQAAAEAGAHYIDLADGRRFVCDFPAALQAAFTAAGRTAIAGASTVPALSSAVIDHLCADWQCIDSIDICIAPAQRAPRGQATLAAVLSYVIILAVGLLTMIPFLAGYPQRITDVVYDTARYAELTPGGALKMISPVLMMNPAFALTAVLQEETQLLTEYMQYREHGRILCTWLMMDRAGCGTIALISSGLMAAAGFVLMCVSVLLVRPRRRKR